MKRLVILSIIMGVGCGGGGGSQPSIKPPLIVSGPAAQNITATSVEIAWQTDKASDSKVRFGRTAYEDSLYTSDLVKDHAIQLSELLPLTTYHYCVASVDAGGLGVTSGDYTFTTLSPADDLIETGWLYFESASFDSALAYFEEALAYEPQNPEALEGKGWAALRLYNFDQAQEAFEAATGSGPSRLDCLVGLVFSYLALEAYADVLETAEAALAVAGESYVFQHDEAITSADLRYARIVAYAALGEFLAALEEIRILDPSVNIDPDDASTWNGHYSFEEALLAIIEDLGRHLLDQGR